MCADLWVSRPDGSGKRRLSASGVDASQSATSLYSWAPDGRSIVYVGARGLAVVDVATGSTRLLVPSKGRIEQFLAFKGCNQVAPQPGCTPPSWAQQAAAHSRR